MQPSIKRYLAHWFLNPKHVSYWMARCQHYLFYAGISTLLIGCLWSLWFAPEDTEQKNMVRILYIHVPSMIGSMILYIFMSVAAAMTLIWRIYLADLFASACAPVGAISTLVGLITGSLWGKPLWGTYWIWDARLTSALILFFFYIISMHLYRFSKTAAHGFTVIGLVNIPIIHYSVQWWNTLHQGNHIVVVGSHDWIMYAPLTVMSLGFALCMADGIMSRMRISLESVRT